jgi:hypothetical protein
VLKYWEGRFHIITLEDRNLPAIAERRVLKPKSEAARQTLDAAFEETTRVREDLGTGVRASPRRGSRSARHGPEGAALSG